jgi:hypothetical protein
MRAERKGKSERHENCPQNVSNSRSAWEQIENLAAKFRHFP